MKSSQPDIKFHFQIKTTLRNRRKLKAAIVTEFKLRRYKLGSLNVIFCSDKYLLDINRQYLQHDYYTDIITFNLASPDEPVEGEIYISVDRVKENAVNARVAINHELHRVIFHGVLHLCGLDDSTSSLRKTMSINEDKLLLKYFFSRGTQ
ncbi:MAG: rRNA maturation RNase YbeY [Chitinophagaceae bacterium]